MKTKQELKQFFENGDKPTQEQFWEWQDSYWHKDETIPQNKVEIDLSQKADLVDGKVPSSQLPSYVDDVLEFATFSELPNPGEKGKIYIATDTGKSYRWSGTMWQVLESTSEEGSNIANTDLTNTNPRTFTQKAAFTWDSLGSPYYWKGLTDQTANLSQYDKVLRIDSATKQVALGDSLEVAVTIPDNLTVNAPAMNVNYTVNHVYPDPVPSLPQNLIDLKNFMATISNLKFTSLTNADFVTSAKSGATVINSNNTIRLYSNIGGNEPQASAQTNVITLPSNKNWIFHVQVSNPTYSGVSGMSFGFNRTSNSSGIQTSEIGTINVPTGGWGFNVVGQDINCNSIDKFSVIYTKVGNMLNISVFCSNGNTLSKNIDATSFIGNYRPVFTCGGCGDWLAYPTYSNFRYWIEP